MPSSLYCDYNAPRCQDAEIILQVILLSVFVCSGSFLMMLTTIDMGWALAANGRMRTIGIILLKLLTQIGFRINGINPHVPHHPL